MAPKQSEVLMKSDSERFDMWHGSAQKDCVNIGLRNGSDRQHSGKSGKTGCTQARSPKQRKPMFTQIFSPEARSARPYLVTKR